MKKGGFLERLISQELKQCGLAIRKADPPFRVTKNMGNARFLGVYESNGVLDFVGVLKGRHVEFDAKDVSNGRFSFSNITKGQMEWADRIYEDGAIVGWFVRFRGVNGEVDRLYLISHSAIHQTLDGGRKSLTPVLLAKMNHVTRAVPLPPVSFGMKLKWALKNIS